MKNLVLSLCVLSALAACSKPEPTYQGKSYYQREMDKQVAADDPARPQRMGREEFRAATREYNPHDYSKDVDNAIEPHSYQLLNIFNRAAEATLR